MAAISCVYLSEASHTLLTDGGKVLQGEAMRSQLVHHILDSCACLHGHLHPMAMSSEQGKSSSSGWQ